MRPILLLTLILVTVLPGPDAGAQCEVVELMSDDGALGDQFGFSVAIEGDRALLGANRDDDDGNNSGAAYVFERGRAGWAQTAKLVASDAAELDRLGVSVALSGDTAFVGTRYDQDAGYGAGAVYVFELRGGSWVETGKLAPTDLANQIFFGTSLAVDGDVLVVGAELGNGEVVEEIDIGVAYVFERLAGVWTQTAKLRADQPSFNDRFGVVVDVQGERIAVGAHETDGLGLDAGVAYVFERAAGVWSQTALVEPSDGGPSDRFGLSVALDGDTLLVGSILADGLTVETGAAYVFEFDGNDWNETAKLLAPDGATGDFFGIAVDLDADLALIGARAFDGPGAQAGAAYAYVRNGPAGTGAPWLLARQLLPGDADTFDEFGHSVVLDGRRALISSRGGQNGAGDASGTTYVFETLGAVFPYGAGCPGSGGFVPRLDLDGCPRPGDLARLRIEDGLGGSVALLLIGLGQGSVPLGLSGCSVEVWPMLDIALPLPLGGAGAGAGVLDAPALIPVDLPTVTFTMQAFVVDPGVPFGRSSTPGVRVTLEP